MKQESNIILKNFLYLFSDNIIRLAVSFVLSVFVARHFGPSKFGQINYILAVIGILQVVVLFGFDSNVLRDIGLKKYDVSTIIGTVVKLRISFAVSCYIIGALVTYFFLDGKLIFLYSVLGIQLFFYVFYVYKLYFQVFSLNKYTVFSQQICFIFVSVGKVLIVIFDGSVELLAACITLGTFIEFLVLQISFSVIEKDTCRKFFRDFDFSYAKQLLKYSLPLVLQNCAVIIYMKIDQVMIGKMMTTREVGIYSISVTISEMVHFIPIVINNAYYPKVIEKKKNNEDYTISLVKIGSMDVLVSIVFSLFCTFIVPFLIKVFYGENYLDAINVIRIHCWATVFVAVGVAHDSYLVFENKQHYSMIASLLSCVLNCVLNYFLIQKFGMNGAAVATLFSQFVVSYLFYAFCKDKTTFLLRTKSLFFVNKLPIRIRKG